MHYWIHGIQFVFLKSQNTLKHSVSLFLSDKCFKHKSISCTLVVSHITTIFWQTTHFTLLWMMWMIHGYHPYPQEFIHHPQTFIRMHPDASMVVPNLVIILAPFRLPHQPLVA